MIFFRLIIMSLFTMVVSSQVPLLGMDQEFDCIFGDVDAYQEETADEIFFAGYDEEGCTTKSQSRASASNEKFATAKSEFNIIRDFWIPCLFKKISESGLCWVTFLHKLVEFYNVDVPNTLKYSSGYVENSANDIDHYVDRDAANDYVDRNTDEDFDHFVYLENICEFGENISQQKKIHQQNYGLLWHLDVLFPEGVSYKENKTVTLNTFSEDSVRLFLAIATPLMIEELAE